MHSSESRYAELAKTQGEMLEYLNQMEETTDRQMRELKEFSKLAIPGSSTGTSDRRTQCRFFHKVGHTEDVCYSKHGFPCDKPSCAYFRRPGHAEDDCYRKRDHQKRSGIPAKGVDPSTSAIMAISDANDDPDVVRRDLSGQRAKPLSVAARIYKDRSVTGGNTMMVNGLLNSGSAVSVVSA